MNNWILIYSLGIAFWVAVFYHGAVRGGAKNPWVFSLIFGVFWPASMVAFIVEMLRHPQK